MPKTYEDLLNPKWKGQKISVDNTSYNLLAGLITAWGKDKAVAYFKRLAAQEPSVMRGDTNRVQLAAAGEFPLIISFAPDYSAGDFGWCAHRLGSSGAGFNADQSVAAWSQIRSPKRSQTFHRLCAFRRGTKTVGWPKPDPGP
jgi:hypothetical protein